MLNRSSNYFKMVKKDYKGKELKRGSFEDNYVNDGDQINIWKI